MMYDVCMYVFVYMLNLEDFWELVFSFYYIGPRD